MREKIILQNLNGSRVFIFIFSFWVCVLGGDLHYFLCLVSLGYGGGSLQFMGIPGWVGIVWLVTELREAGICRAEKDMERPKLQPGLLLFQSTKLLLSRLSSNEPTMCGFFCFIKNVCDFLNF